MRVSDAGLPEPVGEYAAQTVEYVRRAVGVSLEFDSDTLPILDHYLSTMPREDPNAVLLVAVTAGAYFGEVIRRHLGGRWDLTAGDPDAWRLVLPTGMSFNPAGLVAEAIFQSDDLDLSGAFDMPAKLRPHVESALERMGDVTWETYYSLCGRLDTLEHLQDVLLAIAAVKAAAQRGDESV